MGCNLILLRAIGIKGGRGAASSFNASGSLSPIPSNSSSISFMRRFTFDSLSEFRPEVGSFACFWDEIFRVASISGSISRLSSSNCAGGKGLLGIAFRMLSTSDFIMSFLFSSRSVRSFCTGVRRGAGLLFCLELKPLEE